MMAMSDRDPFEQLFLGRSERLTSAEARLLLDLILAHLMQQHHGTADYARSILEREDYLGRLTLHSVMPNVVLSWGPDDLRAGFAISRADLRELVAQRN
jgi:hypothetical protein